MKKTLAILLALVMLLSLCACSNSDSQTTEPSNSSHATTEGTQNPTDGTEGTTGTTQAPTDEPTTAPTDEPTTPPTQAPTETPTTPPTEAPTTPPTTQPTTTQPTTCSHSWKAATCTAPKTCSKCGTTEGGAAGHSYSNGTCSVCGTADPNYNQPTSCSHSWKAATCTAPKTCSKCGTTEGGAAGHNWSDATCTAPKTCKTCNATEGSAAGHSWKDATCTTPKTCSKCGATEGSAAGHSYSNGTCSVCGTADPNYNPLTDGAWLNKDGGDTWLLLVFKADGTCTKTYLRKVIDTSPNFDAAITTFIEDCKNQYKGLWENYVKGCHVIEIDGVRYIAFMDNYNETYTVNGETIKLTDSSLGGEPFVETMTLNGGTALKCTDYDMTYTKVSYTYISNVLSCVN